MAAVVERGFEAADGPAGARSPSRAARWPRRPTASTAARRGGCASWASPAPTARRRRAGCSSPSSAPPGSSAGLVGTTGIRFDGVTRPSAVHDARGAGPAGPAAARWRTRGGGGGARGEQPRAGAAPRLRAVLRRGRVHEPDAATTSTTTARWRPTSTPSSCCSTAATGRRAGKSADRGGERRRPARRRGARGGAPRRAARRCATARRAGADVRARAASRPRPNGLRRRARGRRARPSCALPLLGRYNAWNAAAAFAAARALGVAPERGAAGLAAVAGVPGRLERGRRRASRSRWWWTTPTRPTRSSARWPRCASTRRGRVLVRVRLRRRPRPRQAPGRWAGSRAPGADAVWVTSDNPRSEDPAAIAARDPGGRRRRRAARCALELGPPRAPSPRRSRAARAGRRRADRRQGPRDHADRRATGCCRSTTARWRAGCCARERRGERGHARPAHAASRVAQLAGGDLVAREVPAGATAREAFLAARHRGRRARHAHAAPGHAVRAAAGQPRPTGTTSSRRRSGAAPAAALCSRERHAGMARARARARWWWSRT